MSFLPTQDASTIAGQFEWFMCGYIYSISIFSVAFMIKIFSRAGKEGVDL